MNETLFTRLLLVVTCPCGIGAARAGLPSRYYEADHIRLPDGYYGFDFPHPSSTQRPEFFCSHNRQHKFAINQALIELRFDSG